MDYEDKHAVYMYRCIVYDRVKDFKSVLNDLNKTISINRNHPVLMANYVRGKINIDLKRWGDARNDITKFINKSSTEESSLTYSYRVCKFNVAK